ENHVEDIFKDSFVVAPGLNPNLKVYRDAENNLRVRPLRLTTGTQYLDFTVAKEGLDTLEGQLGIKIVEDADVIIHWGEMNNNRKWSESSIDKIKFYVYNGFAREYKSQKDPKDFSDPKPSNERIEGIVSAFKKMHAINDRFPKDPDITIGADPDAIYHPGRAGIYKPDNNMIVWFEDNSIETPELTAVYNTNGNVYAVLIRTRSDATQRDIDHAVFTHGQGFNDLPYESKRSSTETIFDRYGKGDYSRDPLIFNGVNYSS
ncbi:unnamed protein product, partial [marine sediment metagenome]